MNRKIEDSDVIKMYFELVKTRCAECGLNPNSVFAACGERCFLGCMRNYPILLKNKKNRLDEFLAKILPNGKTGRKDFPQI